MKKKISKTKNLFAQSRILVIGDCMLDTFIAGDVKRISPEAPVPVVNYKEETNHPGGAANVAYNIATLGGNVSLFGKIGDDTPGEMILRDLHTAGVGTDLLHRDKTSSTIQKTRILAGGQHIIRIDKETISSLPVTTEKELLKKVLPKIKTFSAIVFSDYAKGFLTKRIVSSITQEAKKCSLPVVVDAKPSNVHLFKDVTVIKPNHKELTAMTGQGNVTKGVLLLQKKVRGAVLVTLGSSGMYLRTQEGKELTIPTEAKEVFDVSGAGDTVCATLALALSTKMSLEGSAKLANTAAGIVVGKLGTATVTMEELLKAIKTVPIQK